MSVRRNAVYGLGVVAALGMGMATPSQALVILGTEAENVGSGYGVGFSFSNTASLTIGQAFTLNQSIDLSGITVFLNGDGTANPQPEFTFYLTNAIGSGATSANVLFTDTGTFPLNTADGTHAPVSFATDITLAAGTYYLVIGSDTPSPSEDGNGVGWGTNADILPSTYGTVGTAFVGVTGTGGDYTSLNPEEPGESYANFQLSIVPEPATAAALIAPAALLLGRRRRGDAQG